MKTQKEIHPPMTGLEMEFEEQVAASRGKTTQKKVSRARSAGKSATHARTSRREREMEEAMQLGR